MSVALGENVLIDRERIEQAVSAIIEAIGDDPRREGLADTPRRVAEMYSEFFSGLEQDPVEVLATGFEEGHREMVVLKDISFYSICEHHLLPFHGSASIGYVPRGRVVGASKLARSLDILAGRPQMQERLTRQLADTVSEGISPEGVGVKLTAEHMCMTLRGIKRPGARVVTSARRGTMKTREDTWREFCDLVGPD